MVSSEQRKLNYAKINRETKFQKDKLLKEKRKTSLDKYDKKLRQFFLRKREERLEKEKNEQKVKERRQVVLERAQKKQR